MKPLICLLAVLLVANVSLGQTSQPADAPKHWSSPPAMAIDTAKTYTATIDTSKGKIVLKLFAKEAPATVNSFVFLAKQGFYNGTIFHRVIPGFMIQGGDPIGTGTGGPGYKFNNENQSSTHGFTPGTLAMANAGPDTNGSQFFICDAKSGLPASGYTIFGEVTDGQSVVHAIATAPRNGDDRPDTRIVINSVTIEEK